MVQQCGQHAPCAPQPGATRPTTYLAPGLKGSSVFTYPDDDDFVHFVFKNIIDQYGWGYMDELMAQEPTFVRGIGTPIGLIAAGKKAATFAGFWSFADKASGVVWLPPRRSSFASWGQTAAIFRAASVRLLPGCT